MFPLLPFLFFPFFPGPRVYGSWLFTLLWSSSISWWYGSTQRAARQSLRAPKTSPMCSWNAARKWRRWRSALNAIARDNSAMASVSLWLSINTAHETRVQMMTNSVIHVSFFLHNSTKAHVSQDYSARNLVKNLHFHFPKTKNWLQNHPR